MSTGMQILFLLLGIWCLFGGIWSILKEKKHTGFTYQDSWNYGAVIAGVITIGYLILTTLILPTPPHKWFYSKIGYEMPHASNIQRAEDKAGMFGDGDEIHFFQISREDMEVLVNNISTDEQFSDWMKGPQIAKGSYQNSDKNVVPFLPHGSKITDGPFLPNDDKLEYSIKLTGPKEYPEANYVEIFIKRRTGEVLVHESDS